MPSTGALPYQPVAVTNPAQPRLPLPIGSPTLLTRRRYSRASVVGFGKGGTLAPNGTGRVQAPQNGQGSVWPQWPHVMRSDVGVFQGGITGLENNPNQVKMPIGIGLNFLVTIAHRSTNPNPAPAINAGLWARQSNVASKAPAQGPGRRYSLPYQFGFNQVDQTWTTSSQWLASRMAGTG